jgi:glycosyltransferase involved in cell wall biosynthesis
MKKALIITTISGFAPKFEANNIKTLLSMGYEIHYASNFNIPVYKTEKFDNSFIIEHQIDFARSPYRIISNIKAYKQMKKLLESHKFNIIHCHTPMGGFIGRLANKNAKFKAYMIYTAHGFHFYKGAPIVNWLFYYPIEKYMSRYTDTLITINKEDFNIAKKKFFMKNIEYFFEPGFDYNRYNIMNSIKANKFNYLNDGYEIVLLTVGELNKNKNQKVVIEALTYLKDLNIRYILCGEGNRKKYLHKLSKRYGVEDKLLFLGYRNDINEILKYADIYIMPSIREGFGLAAIEAMAAGLPIIATNNRGSREYLIQDQADLLCNYNRPDQFASAIRKLYNDKTLINNLKKNNVNIARNYDYSRITPMIMKVYSKRMEQ